MKTTAIIRRLLLFLFLLFLHPAVFAEEAGTKLPWPGLSFAEARVYAWPAEMQPSQLVQADKSLLPGMVNKEGALLSEAQVKRLAAAVSGKHPIYQVARCHIPRHAVVFYDREKKPVAFLELCLDCKSKRAEPEVAEYLDLGAIVDLFAELKLPLGNFKDAAAFKKSIEFGRWVEW